MTYLWQYGYVGERVVVFLSGLCLTQSWREGASLRNGYQGGGGVTHLQSFTFNLYISRILLPQKLTFAY